ncbi:MAG: hypothetical protein COB66_07320, partial [Coxiella sp. (in: Bacteria)]
MSFTRSAYPTIMQHLEQIEQRERMPCPPECTDAERQAWLQAQQLESLNSLKSLMTYTRSLWASDVKEQGQITREATANLPAFTEKLRLAYTAFDERAEQSIKPGDVQATVKQLLRQEALEAAKKDLEGQQAELTSLLGHRLGVSASTADIIDMRVQASELKDACSALSRATTELKEQIAPNLKAEAENVIARGNFSVLIRDCGNQLCHAAMLDQPRHKLRLKATVAADQAIAGLQKELETPPANLQQIRTKFRNAVGNVDKTLPAGTEQFSKESVKAQKLSAAIPDFDPITDTCFSGSGGFVPKTLQDLAASLATLKALASAIDGHIATVNSPSATKSDKTKAAQQLVEAQRKLYNAADHLHTKIIKPNMQHDMTAIKSGKMTDICRANRHVVEATNLKIRAAEKTSHELLKFGMAAAVFPPLIPFMAAKKLYSRSNSANLPRTADSDWTAFGSDNVITENPNYASNYGAESVFVGTSTKTTIKCPGLEHVVLPVDGVRSNDPKAKSFSIAAVVEKLQKDGYNVSLKKGDNGKFKVYYKGNLNHSGPAAKQAWRKAVNTCNTDYLKWKDEKKFSASYKTTPDHKIAGSMTTNPAWT